MDTDELSIEAYNAVILKSDYFNHDLTLQFGVLASICKDETEYLEKSLSEIKCFQSNIELAKAEIFYDHVPETNEFELVLNELQESIRRVQKTPIDKRTFEEW